METYHARKKIETRKGGKKTGTQPEKRSKTIASNGGNKKGKTRKK